MKEITYLLRAMERGEQHAAEQLLKAVYEELRQLAAARMSHEASGHTLQSTALVHEAWLRLGGDAQPGWENRRHFFGAAAEAMRRILIDRSRRKQAVRHGGNLERVDIDAPGLEVVTPAGAEKLVEVHEALELLARDDPRKAELVKLRYFVGLSLEEAADVLGISERTAKRDWAYARAWLGRELEQMRAH